MMKEFLDALKFNRGQQKGLVSLFAVIIVLQLFIWFDGDSLENASLPDGKNWLSLQTTIDEFEVKSNKDHVMFPFNPNFISDYKGYKLGLTSNEIDRLHAFRKTNRFVNSVEEFQKVTGVSNSVLDKIAPFIKFPDWVKAKNYPNTKTKEFHTKREKKSIVKLDINLASKEDFMNVYGIGEVFASRIIIQRKSVKAFVAMEQLNEVWGLSLEALENLNIHFYISQAPSIDLIDINNASLKELSQFFYFKNTLAKQILIYRSMNGDFKNIEDLSNIKGFPVDKAKIIALYLKF